jgi:Transposase DDE domain
MMSIARMNQTLKRLFEQDAPTLAKQAGMRERKVRFTQLALLLVMGWWNQPQSGPSALARLAGSLDLTLSKQAVDCHFTERTAQWLLALLRRAVQELVCSAGMSLAWMEPFTNVFVEDGSTISLPSTLAHLWQGCGGKRATTGKPDKSKAALKVTVRFDLKGGSLNGPHLHAGRRHDLASVLSHQQMPAGSLWLADLGYWSLNYLSSLMKQGVYFCMRVKMGAVLWHQQQRTDVVSLLAGLSDDATQAEWLVDVGVNKLLKQVRLLVKRVPAEVAAQRQQRLREYANKHSKPVNPLALDLAWWTIIITNVPRSMLSLPQAFVVMRARWQVELLFKLWKQEALVDEWTTGNPWRILCEVYAKLLAMVVQHWMLVLTCWDDPHHSLTEVAEILREQVPTLVHGLCQHLPLGKALRLVMQSVRGGCSIEARSTRLSASRLIQSAFEPLLT